MNHVIRGTPDPSRGNGKFFGGVRGTSPGLPGYCTVNDVSCLFHVRLQGRYMTAVQIRWSRNLSLQQRTASMLNFDVNNHNDDVIV